MDSSESTTAVAEHRVGPARFDPTLVVVLTGVLLVAMSVVSTGVALPRIADDLNTSGPALQWSVSAYSLTFGVLTLVFGSVADMIGRRRTFLLAIATLGVAGLISAASVHIVMLDLSRGLAGVGGAAVMASGGALLAANFSGAARLRAFAAMGATAGIGISIGPLVSGWLVSLLDWRAIMAAYAIASVLVLLVGGGVPESRSSGTRRLDLVGTARYVGALTLVMFGVIQGSESGWLSGPVLTMFVLGLALLAWFVLAQRKQTDPLLDVSLVKQRAFGAWCLAVLATEVGFPGVVMYLPTWLQGANGASAGIAGAQMLMLTAPVLVIPRAAAWLMNRGVPGRLLITAALVLMAIGNACLTTISPGMTTVELLLPLLILGVGMGISFGTTDGQAMSTIDLERAGMAAGFLNTIRGAGSAIVIAAFGSGLLGILQARLGSREEADQMAAGTLDGSSHSTAALEFSTSWHIMSWIVAGFCAVSACVVFVLLPSSGDRAHEADHEELPE